MLHQNCNQSLAIAFASCYTPKSGKKTEGIGKFWSGCTTTVKHGLEICTMTALDLDNTTAMHLCKLSTLPK